MTFLFREHRGLLDDSMETVIKLESFEELEAKAKEITEFYGWGDEVKVEPYAYDIRIEWDTHLVTVGGNAIGFTNAMVDKA
ncbi:MAG: hypothetical protein ABUJ92_00455 [Desulfobacterales bacterium]